MCRFRLSLAKDLVTNWVNGIIDKAKEAWGWLKQKGMQAASFFGDVEKISANGFPHFANGVRNFAGGLAVVGERGRELVNLPSGSDVIPNHELGGNNITVVVEMAGAFIGDEFSARKMSELMGNNIIKQLQTQIRF